MGLHDLPVTALREPFLAALEKGPVVRSSPTGSGKSTEVPRWCPQRVLVVEPRRIACRSLATRVAQLEGTRVGEGVGYVVRDEHEAGTSTRIVFVTPGMVLRNRALLESAHTVILDEFHERSLDTDLLLALLLRRKPSALVIMSATLEGERVASHVGGVHLAAEGRSFPVDVRYLPGRTSSPDGEDLPKRVAQAVTSAANDPRRKLILATNVAETSLTIPGVGVVIDSGLVRQTRYHAGRGFLALTPIAQDSAAQRAGRAGRTAPGVCYRLWSPGARLAASTLPEIHRESLVPLVLTAAAWGEQVESLPLLDVPKPYALEAARIDLAAWDALRDDAALSDSGKSLFELPIDAQHARLLVAARAHGCLEDMIDLVSVLSVGRLPFVAGEQLGVDEDLRFAGCDATAAIGALRAAQPADHGVVEFVAREARAARVRLRRAEGLPERAPTPGPIDRDAIVRAVLAADARSAHVARTRGRDTYFSNGGTEIELARESAAQNLRNLEAILVLDSRAFGVGRDARVLGTCAMAVPLSVLARAGLGHDRLAAVKLDRKRVVAHIERVFANKVLAEREDTPQGALARDALVQLLVRGSLFRDAVASTRDQLRRNALASWLAARGHPAGVKLEGAHLTLEEWLRAKVDSLGVESGEDLALLSASDFVAPALPYETSSAIDGDYPATVNVGDASYRAEYDLTQSQVTLHLVKGNRNEPPPLSYLPKFPGLRISAESRRGITVLRALIPSQDVIIEVIDARLPASSSNPVLSELRGQKPCIKVLSKTDLADPALTDAWLRYFVSQPNVSALVSSTNDRNSTRQRIAKLSRDAALARGPKKEVRALIAGVPNVGKSTLINTLMQRSVAAVSDKPAVTKEQQTVILKDGTLLTDSPGVTWPKMEDESGALRLAFAGSIPDTAIDYLTVASFGAQLLLERYAALLVTRYKLKQTPESPTALLTEIAKRRGGLRPGGVVDLHKAAEILVHEFRAGTLGRITLEMPPG